MNLNNRTKIARIINIIDKIIAIIPISIFFITHHPFLTHQLKPAQLIQQRTRLVIGVVMIAVKV